MSAILFGIFLGLSIVLAPAFPPGFVALPFFVLGIVQLIAGRTKATTA